MNARPRLLDLFCCQGGGAMGYHRAGFDLYGVDVEPQPRYPFAFRQHDALEVLHCLLDSGGSVYTKPDGRRELLTLRDFQAIHASPPCPAYSTITPDKSLHPRLIAPVRDLLRATGLPYVIENVEGARADLDHPVKLCGSSFGLKVRRHRYFETNVPMMQPHCEHGRQGRPIGVYGDHPQDDEYYRRPDGTRRGNKAKTVEEAGAALRIDWMDWRGLAESIPPDFTEYIGGWLMSSIDDRSESA